jgi:hypothetical protein
MVAVTYGVARAAVPAVEAKTTATKTPAKRKSFFIRAFDAIAAAQMRRAEREIASHRHLLALSLEPYGERRQARSKAELPFGGR